MLKKNKKNLEAAAAASRAGSDEGLLRECKINY